MKASRTHGTATERLFDYLQQLTYSSLPASTLTAAKCFMLDSIGVGISGSRVDRVSEVKAATHLWGHAEQAQVWTTGEWLPATSAALINAYQIHNQEWDCLQEGAVVHPMATILSALMAFGQRHSVSGQQLVLGLVAGVDIATIIGQSATSALKFFRPSVCGCLGASAGICVMMGIKGERLKNALGIAYSQLSGTMQAHVEGSPTLAMQVGFNAQNAIMAVDMAEAGFAGPHDILEGPFGYFSLFEDGYDLAPFFTQLGQQFQIETLSHKPFPTGRAAHGTIEALQTLQQRHGFSAGDIMAVEVLAPPLVNRLVNRPVLNDMDVNYAKLCNGFIGATTLLTGGVGVNDFDSEHRHDAQRLALAKKFTMQQNSIVDANALAPIEVTVRLNNGATYQIELRHILGHPQHPLTIEQQLEKFHRACASAQRPFTSQQIDKLINSIDAIEQIPNINNVIKQMVGEL
ncbi:MmgE/PrpD family protein [Thalassotalea maritima]|uniref:MmgE/PrpD family protein n=1 Tax=Thalassotalea maritima TaxID=3242416 RepID=UPI0035289480